MPIMQQNPHATLSVAIEDLKAKGYTLDFNQQGAHLECKELNRNFKPEEFTITHAFRFEGMSSAGDNSVLYALETADGQKGQLVDAYGVYADSLSPEMIEKFRVDYKDKDAA